MENFVTASELLPELSFQALPEGSSPLGALVLAKLLDENGEVSWSIRTSDAIYDEEIVGALTITLHNMTREVAALYRGSGESID